MNAKTITLLFSALLTCSSLTALAEDNDPKTALPVDGHAQPKESNQEKANKKGEESSGANAGMESEVLKKDAGKGDNGKTSGRTQ
jgi:hypothetical protein